MITGNESLKQLADLSELLIPVFEKHGLGSYFKSENLQKIGRFLKLESLLHAKGIDTEQFIRLLNNTLSDQQADQMAGSLKIDEHLQFASMLPCGLRNPFKEYFESLVLDNQEQFGELNYLVEGNVNHELSYYPLLDGIRDAGELPDIIMASDVNNFYHKPFMDRFIDKGAFASYMPYDPNKYLEKTGFADPRGNFTMFTANMLVMVVDQARLEGRPVPEAWGDLLEDCYQDEIIMRGEDNFFCNAVMLPFYKDNGFGAIKRLAHNIKSGMHPAEMVKLAGSGKSEGSLVYIMPYFFAKKIRNEKALIIWPEDGAIASPVFMLVKKEKLDMHRNLLDLLMNKETGNVLYGRNFPSMHPEIIHDRFPEPLKWLGWDFLYGNDIGRLKEDIRDVFMDIWNKKPRTS